MLLAGQGGCHAWGAFGAESGTPPSPGSGVNSTGWPTRHISFSCSLEAAPWEKVFTGEVKKHLHACHFLNALETWPRGYYHTSLKSRNNSRHKEKTVPFESQAAWKAGLKLDLCSWMPIRDSVVSFNKICLALHWISDRFVEWEWGPRSSPG